MRFSSVDSQRLTEDTRKSSAQHLSVGLRYRKIVVSNHATAPIALPSNAALRNPRASSCEVLL